MKIVKIHGGLGNQMFQYAFARSLAAETSEPVLIDPSCFGIDPAHNGFELGRLFTLSLPVAEERDVRRLSIRPQGLMNRLRRKYLTKRTHVIDRKFGYQPELSRLPGEVYYEGYWQSEKYFAGIAELIRRELAFRPGLSARNEELLQSLPRPLISVHVRRGDYLEHPNLNLCTPAYYSRAARLLGECGAASLLVFSDDIAYCQRSLDFGGIPATYVDWNRGPDSWQDMAMMSRCDHQIIANSSFSWWGAWLNPSRSKRVLAPAIWNRREIEDRDHYYEYRFGDVVPKEWERVAL